MKWTQRISAASALLAALAFADASSFGASGFSGVSSANAQATTGIFEGVGEIIDINKKCILAYRPMKKQVVVGHDEIKGFVKAMPTGMGYNVDSLDLLNGLKLGDRVRFKVDAGTKLIVSIEPL